MNILVTIPFSSQTAKSAETCIDHLYHACGKKPIGCALLVAARDVHAEVREKMKIAADLAFENHAMIQLPDGGQDLTVAGKFIADNYRVPFLWLCEPDKFRPAAGWLAALDRTYHNQPKRYFLVKGSFMGVYPNDAVEDAEDDISLATRDAASFFTLLNKKG